jgi:hypothetical protein
MAIPKTPCYGCDKRSATCHCECNDYKLFKDAMADYNDIINSEKERERKIRSYEIRNFNKRTHKR